MPRIPNIPGDRIDDVEHVRFLKEQVARLCGLDRYRYVVCFFNLFVLNSHIIVTDITVSSGFLAVSPSALAERISLGLRTRSMFAHSSNVAFLLTINSYWVCEKSDGVRVLVFVRCEENTSAVYLVCSHYEYTVLQCAHAVARLTDMISIAWCQDTISHSLKTLAAR